MTDLQMTKLCAEAMGLSLDYVRNIPHVEERDKRIGWDGSFVHVPYDPLHDDAQAMALVKRFRLSIYESDDMENGWDVWGGETGARVCGDDTDLNRAICECVARMQESR